MVLDVVKVLERTDEKGDHVHHDNSKEEHPDEPSHVVDLAEVLDGLVILLLFNDVLRGAQGKSDRVLFLFEVLLELVLGDQLCVYGVLI